MSFIHFAIFILSFIFRLVSLRAIAPFSSHSGLSMDFLVCPYGFQIILYFGSFEEAHPISLCKGKACLLLVMEGFFPGFDILLKSHSSWH